MSALSNPSHFTNYLWKTGISVINYIDAQFSYAVSILIKILDDKKWQMKHFPHVFEVQRSHSHSKFDHRYILVSFYCFEMKGDVECWCT